VTTTVALVLVVAFMAMISLLGVPARAQVVVARSRQALADMRSKSLTDLEKEHAVQAHARSLFGSFFMITLLAAIALALPVALVALLASLEVVDFDTVMAATLSWPILIAATVIGLGMLALQKVSLQKMSPKK